MSSLSDKYVKEVVPKLKEEFGLKNNLSLPRIEKIVLNTGAAEALSDKGAIEKISEQMAAIAGQQPSVTKARHSISTFKLKSGDKIGVMVTLRGKKTWNFLEKFIATVAPRMRDFRGMPTEKFDQKGNYSFGITEQILFPEIDYSKVDKTRGLVMTLVIKNSNRDKSKRVLELLGLPFKKES
ncbi:MAG: 50S ribosomal protein L5 [Candidatus Curtissbacteria bacterium GW2011_GWA1_41_11]|uniref:Large ribosomal subunit protein uL5 n=1 Tax=Candidatus Curtissbacteria bacterium GW2011_GWA1_41_11 TaxID=1618409 RepID=A0A0G0UC32_9BACT|nr:MAG: 50S ribosomal protein L5 [Candidatus Curtissbacteria bacterium GW2011_GWA1_41_11]